jgi:hypothetical protein
MISDWRLQLPAQQAIAVEADAQKRVTYVG